MCGVMRLICSGRLWVSRSLGEWTCVWKNSSVRQCGSIRLSSGLQIDRRQYFPKMSQRWPLDRTQAFVSRSANLFVATGHEIINAFTSSGMVHVSSEIKCEIGGKVILNGKVLNLKPKYEVGEMAVFACETQEGFQMDGHPNLVCLGDGRWSHKVPQCNPIPCPSPPR